MLMFEIQIRSVFKSSSGTQPLDAFPQTSDGDTLSRLKHALKRKSMNLRRYLDRNSVR